MDVEVLVGVEMGRIPAEQPAELGQLAPRLGDHGQRLLERHDGVHDRPLTVALEPLADIQMKADRQGAAAARLSGRGPCGRPADHQACAGEDAVLVRSENSLVDGGRPPEVVSGDDQDPPLAGVRR